MPAGVAEEIYVQFTPSDEYKMYNDFIRIHCESDKICIPLFAYPVINSRVEEIFPQFIDMGSYLKVDSTYKKVSFTIKFLNFLLLSLLTKVKTIAIESNCPISFKFEIEVLQDHPDIYISNSIY